MLNMEVVAPDYFATLGIPVLRGRPFTDQDREGALPAVIVSSSTARHFWPGDDPIGKRVHAAGREAMVVGVVPDTRYRELYCGEDRDTGGSGNRHGEDAYSERHAETPC